MSDPMIVVEDAKVMSFSLVGRKHGLTRSQVAGIVWRSKNPGQKRNGRGYGRGKYAPITMHNINGSK